MQHQTLTAFSADNAADSYAMEVLLYLLHQKASADSYLFRGQPVVIDDTYLKEPVRLELKPTRTAADTLAVLLTVRALSLNSRLMNYCQPTGLLFGPSLAGGYGWVKLFAETVVLLHDGLFKALYIAFQEAADNGELSSAAIKNLNTVFPVPEKRNLVGHYQAIASAHNGIFEGVFCSCLYVEDTTTESITIPAGIAYVGDTAIAYCPNLTEIVVEGSDVLFGRFPIVECGRLQQIVVPAAAVNRYKVALPYYRNIIVSEKEDVLPQIERRAETETVVPEMNYKLLRTSIKESNNLLVSYCWLAIFRLLNEKNNLPIPVRDVAIKMASLAWPDIMGDALRTAPKCKLAECLAALQKKTKITAAAAPEAVEAMLRAKYGKEKGLENTALLPLICDAPYEILRPWTGSGTREQIIKLSAIASASAPYAIDGGHVVLDEDWADYIAQHSEELTAIAKQAIVKIYKKYNSPLQMLRLIRG